ncbi:hypothetical protein [Embleya sp. NPDC005575]|uniref:hypothetical protein n=1 Tax=Embleya sp. NPDC005575 TaxID=3156892 RepID=UPI0033A08C1F
MISPRSLTSRLDRLGTRPQRLIGLAVARIGLGATFVLIYLSNLQYRNLLWGPHGAADFDQFRDSMNSPRRYSLYMISESTPWFNAVFFTGLIVAVLWTVYGTRPLTLLHAIFVWSLYERNESLLDGGDNLNRILVILLIFTTTNAYFSPGAKKVRARLASREPRPRAATSMHNVAATLVVFQTVVVYAVAGLWKVVGSRWREGNALYYITRVDEFSTNSVMPWLMKDPFLLTGATYLTIAVQLAIVPAALTRRRRFREGVLLLIVGMHLGIMYGMGLVSFGLFMMAGDTTILNDDDYRAARRNLRATVGRIRHRHSRLDQSRPHGSPAPKPRALEDIRT